MKWLNGSFEMFFFLIILQSLLKIFYIFAATLWQEQPAVRILLHFESGTQKGIFFLHGYLNILYFFRIHL